MNLVFFKNISINTLRETDFGLPSNSADQDRTENLNFVIQLERNSTRF